MRAVTSIADWRSAAEGLRAAGHSVALVPTMGALHAGHASLIEAACRDGHQVIVTIFVNQRQFNDASDFARYPRTTEADLEVARAAGATLVALPTADEMWPVGTATTVHVGAVSENWEGADRPGHFDGMASVVTKLLAITGPCTAYFGEKDFQQLAIIRRLVTDLGLPVTVVGAPIIRDDDGLALSSRNVRLSAGHRDAALAIPAAVARAARGGSVTDIEADARNLLVAAGLTVSYAAVVNAATLAPFTAGDTGPARFIVAAIVGDVRLLDNGPAHITGDHHAARH
jgi:pantoate--beta-alanine ligase